MIFFFDMFFALRFYIQIMMMRIRRRRRRRRRIVSDDDKVARHAAVVVPSALIYLVMMRLPLGTSPSSDRVFLISAKDSYTFFGKFVISLNTLEPSLRFLFT